MVVFGYVFLWFFMSRLVIPYLGFKKTPIPDKIPKEIENAIKELKKKNKTKESYLKAAFMLITKKYFGQHRRTYSEFGKLFQRDLKKLWHNEGFQQCTIQNHMLRVLLVKSGLFKDSDIRFEHNFFEFSIHQDMFVNVNGRTVALDPWGYKLGLPFARIPDYIWTLKYDNSLYDGLYRKNKKK
jgi:hypothetical protein